MRRRRRKKVFASGATFAGEARRNHPPDRPLCRERAEEDGVAITLE
jgi:hypothetical protein